MAILYERYNSLINDYEHVELMITKTNDSEYLAYTLNDGVEINAELFTRFDRALLFIHATRETLNGLGIIDKYKNLNC